MTLPSNRKSPHFLSSNFNTTPQQQRPRPILPSFFSNPVWASSSTPYSIYRTLDTGYGIPDTGLREEFEFYFASFLRYTLGEQEERADNIRC
jgi:hypothetical protein